MVNTRLLTSRTGTEIDAVSAGLGSKSADDSDTDAVSTRIEPGDDVGWTVISRVATEPEAKAPTAAVTVPAETVGVLPAFEDAEMNATPAGSTFASVTGGSRVGPAIDHLNGVNQVLADCDGTGVGRNAHGQVDDRLDDDRNRRRVITGSRLGLVAGDTGRGRDGSRADRLDINAHRGLRAHGEAAQ